MTVISAKADCVYILPSDYTPLAKYLWSIYHMLITELATAKIGKNFTVYSLATMDLESFLEKSNKYSEIIFKYFIIKLAQALANESRYPSDLNRCEL